MVELITVPPEDSEMDQVAIASGIVNQGFARVSAEDAPGQNPSKDCRTSGVLSAVPGTNVERGILHAALSILHSIQGMIAGLFELVHPSD